MSAVGIKVLKTASCLNSSEKEKAAAAFVNKRPGHVHVHGSNLALPRTEMLAQPHKDERHKGGATRVSSYISHQKIP